MAIPTAATLGDGLTLLPSTLGPQAGWGLFTTRPFAKHSYITEYAGERITRTTAITRRAQQADQRIRSCGFSSGWCVDGLRSYVAGQGGGAFVNDARTARATNATFVTHYLGDKIYVKARRALAAHEEVFCNYGNYYWRHHPPITSWPGPAAP